MNEFYKLVWILLGVTFLFALYFSYRSIEGVLLYRLTLSKASVEQINFTVQEGSWGRYYLEGSYRFRFKDELFEGKTRLSHPVFLNLPSAEEEAIKADKEKWTVYFDAQRPSWSTLERTIPFKEIVSALLLWVSLGYLLNVQRKLKG